MDELLEFGDVLENPMLIGILALAGGGGVMALLFLGSFLTTGDVSDLIWAIVLLLLQG